MRYIEIILKLGFLGLSIFFMVTLSIGFVPVSLFLAICFILGFVLIFSTDSSYHFKQTHTDLSIRKIEGVILIIFAGIMSAVCLYPY